jgi:hypothetical protein
MAFDEDRKRTVLFGGDALGPTSLGDTWEWDGNAWTQMTDIGPSPRLGHAMAFDGLAHQMVMFGGEDRKSTFGDTWAWDGSDWTQLADGGPVPRRNHTLSFDTGRARLVLFGGVSAAETLLGDTWEWDGVEWTQQEDTGPSPRQLPMGAYDSVRHRTVLFGGAQLDGAGLGDTWEWDGSTWTQLSSFGATPRAAAAMVFKRDGISLFGGVASVTPGGQPRVFADTWEWDGKHWTLRQDIGPGTRWRHAMAYDSTRGHIVLFGGVQAFPTQGEPQPDQLLGDTWEHHEQSVVSGPVIIRAFTITPRTMAVGQFAKGLITLSGAAPEGGVTVGFSQDPEAPALDYSPVPPFNIPAHSSELSFDITGPLSGLSGPQDFEIVLTLATSGASARLLVTPT